jgi:ADP-ribose pyrophosphatase YjhB (NUDIX family)
LRTSSELRNPVPAVDIIIRQMGGIVLVRRKNPPEGWALPGGFVDYGETLEDAAMREAKEETGLNVKLIRQFHSYSDPNRDPRRHVITTVFLAEASGQAAAGDDAAEIGVFSAVKLPDKMAFDHRQILEDFITGRY